MNRKGIGTRSLLRISWSCNLSRLGKKNLIGEGFGLRTTFPTWQAMASFWVGTSTIATHTIPSSGTVTSWYGANRRFTKATDATRKWQRFWLVNTAPAFETLFALAAAKL